MYRPDDQLVAAYLERGDQLAFRQLVERHQERVYGYLLGMVRDRTTADDLFQETFMRVISAMQQKRSAYTQQGRWLGWVMRIARNAALDHFRSRRKWTDVQAGEKHGDVSFWERLADDAPHADEVLHRKEQWEVLRRCIDKLPRAQREVLLLRQESDLTFREIAEMTGVSINTALGRMRYAMLNLRKMAVREAPAMVREAEIATA